MPNYMVVPLRTNTGDFLGLIPEKSVSNLENVLVTIKKRIDQEKIDMVIVVPDIILSIHPGIVDEIVKEISRKINDAEAPIAVIIEARTLFKKILSRLIVSPMKSLYAEKHKALAIVIPTSIISRDNEKVSMKFNEIITMKISLDLPFKSYFYLFVERLPKILATTILEPIRISKFAIVGFTGFIVNYVSTKGCLLLLSNTNILGVPQTNYFIASLTGFEVSLTWNFVFHEIWTFKDLKLKPGLRAKLIRWIKYHTASLGSLATQTSSVVFLSGVLGLPLILSVFIGVSLGFIVNYLIGRFYTWREEKER